MTLFLPYSYLYGAKIKQFFDRPGSEIKDHTPEAPMMQTLDSILQELGVSVTNHDSRNEKSKKADKKDFIRNCKKTVMKHIYFISISRWHIFSGSAINWLLRISFQTLHLCHKFTIITRAVVITTFNFRVSFLFHLTVLRSRRLKNGMIFQFTSNQLVNFEFLKQN